MTCKYLKWIIPPRFWIYPIRIYKSDSNVRIDLEFMPDDDVEFLQKYLKEQHGIVMFRDDIVHLPNDYVVREELK